MNAKCLLTLVLAHLTFSAIEHSSERLQNALTSNCELRKLYKEHIESHVYLRSPDEIKRRMMILREEIRTVLTLRENKAIKWHAGINLMADMTPAEKKLMKGASNTTANKKSLNMKLNNSEQNLQQKRSTFSKHPPHFDGWRKGGWIGAVKRQGQKRADCWAHAAIVPIEAQLAYEKQGPLVELSVQELYDCTYPKLTYKELENEGGLVSDAWDYIAKTGRLTDEKHAPYTGREWQRWVPGSTMGRICKKKNYLGDTTRFPNMLEGYVATRTKAANSDEDLFEYLYCYSPVTVSIDSTKSNLEQYKGPNCLEKPFKPAEECSNEDTDHAMVVVGYSEKSYIIRNSWGYKFGVDGYVYWDRTGEKCGLFKRAWAQLLERKDRKNPGYQRAKHGHLRKHQRIAVFFDR